MATVRGRDTVEVSSQRRPTRRTAGGQGEVVAIKERENRRGWGRPAATTMVVGGATRVAREGVASGDKAVSGGGWAAGRVRVGYHMT